jgi:hypothetical protein
LRYALLLTTVLLIPAGLALGQTTTTSTSTETTSTSTSTSTETSTTLTTSTTLIVPGGGARTSDCLVVFSAPGANHPDPPRPPRSVDCIDGDPSCDADGLRNARCSFPLELCINSTGIKGCSVNRTDSVAVDHSIDNCDPHFDTDFQALQNRADLLGFPDNVSHDKCTLPTSITVNLIPPRDGTGSWKKGRKTVRVTATGFTDRPATDRDNMRFTCRPEGNGLYTPRDLYTSTFDRIRQQVFAPSCALSGCHDSNTHQGMMILLPNAAYSEIVNVTPFRPAAADAGWKRILPGDPTSSFLYRKITCTLPDSSYGACMPFGRPEIAQNLQELIRLWIIGDGTTGPAPDDCPNGACWVQGTDQ